jgi:hypothetical protein
VEETMTLIYGSGKYKYGFCHVFALALHKVFGYQIAALEDKDRTIDHTRLHKSFPYIPHVFCVKGDYIIDAFGVRKSSTMIRQSGIVPITHPKIHKIDSRSLYNNSMFYVPFEKITNKNLEEAVAFVLKNKGKYRV